MKRLSVSVGSLRAPRSQATPGVARNDESTWPAPSRLTFPTNLAGGTAVVSIEPSPDDSPSPFKLKPLTGAIPAAAVDHVTYPMTAQTSGFPRGTAVIR